MTSVLSLGVAKLLVTPTVRSRATAMANFLLLLRRVWLSELVECFIYLKFYLFFLLLVDITKIELLISTIQYIVHWTAHYRVER